ncbi:uncharacterized protein LOC123308600 [Coccinella septempunctata]|uniref:uncharacterized protein LOC123308600 n=1 Tax=Coccinella septempunctata TaxID=41139 RepID=UPI001D074A2F|nr:uncharacterized protein LOC123308600 [Coccinella septempunctata]
MNAMLAIVFFAAFAAANSAVIAPAYYTAPITYTSRLIASPYASVPVSTQVVGGAASEDTLIAGPSGTISTSKNVAGPAVATRYAPVATPVHTVQYSAIPYAYTHYGGLYL